MPIIGTMPLNILKLVVDVADNAADKFGLFGQNIRVA
jgi:hypothetical protein